MLWTLILPAIISFLLLLADLRGQRGFPARVLCVTRVMIIFLGLHLLGSIAGPPAMVAVACCVFVPIAYMGVPEAWVTSRPDAIREPAHPDPDLLTCIGRAGTCTTSLRPEGYVRMDGGRWEAVSDSEYLAPGTIVVVTGIRNQRLLLVARECM